MIKTVSLLIVLFAVFRSSLLNAQPGDLVMVDIPASHLREGKITKVEISVMVKQGYHIQANDVDDESLIPTSLVVDGGENVVTVRDKFPRSKRFKLEGTDTFLKVYDGKFPVRVYLTPATGSQAGKYHLAGRLQYQACDTRTCLFPRVLEFSIPVEIGP